MFTLKSCGNVYKFELVQVLDNSWTIGSMLLDFVYFY